MCPRAKAIVETIVTGSIADEIGIKVGDELVSINGQCLTDLIDYQYAVADEAVTVIVRRPGGGEWMAEIEKDFDDDLGIGFASAVFDGIKRCHNACLFCFVDQMPPGMRDTLYVKDDDYRLSFLSGTFVTLTNLSEADLARIMRLRLSPLYVSVHATDPVLRVNMLRQPKAAQLMSVLRRLVEGGIAVHTQIVLCPGINDQENLERTIKDLSGLGSGLLSVAIVPVGLTKYRRELPQLHCFTPEGAAAVVELVKPWQQRFQHDYGEPLVYLSDEFYLSAGLTIPEYDMYGDFPQIENGIGLARLFMHTWQRAVRKAPRILPRQRKVTLIGGISGARIIEPLVQALAIERLSVQFIAVPNSFFGGSVTVTGLLTGKDIIAALQRIDLGDLAIIPGSVLKQGEGILLDNLTIRDIAARLSVPVEVAYSPEELLEKILGLKESGDGEARISTGIYR